MKSLTILHSPTKDSSAPRVRVSYRQSESGQPQEHECEFHFEFTEEERELLQWYLEEYLEYPTVGFSYRAQTAEELIPELGERLFNAIFSDSGTRGLYSKVENDLANTRIVIHAADPEGISVPWELMRDPEKHEYGDLVALANAFVRSQPNLFFDAPSPDSGERLNVLMVICRPGGPDNDIPYQVAARPLLELFREHKDRVALHVLRPPTFEQLARELADKPDFYHVLHFDGHGAFPKGEEGQLLFESEDGKSRFVSGEELGQALAGKSVPIVLLDACQSGMTRPDSLYVSVGNQLLRAGVCGVVAMTYSVWVQTSVRYMARLYEGLVNGKELSRSVNHAREELRAHPQRSSPVGEVTLQDWMVPVLFESDRVRVLTPREDKLHLDLTRPEGEKTVAGSEIGCPEPPEYGFVGRDEIILKLERAFQSDTIVLTHGMAGIGKTQTSVAFGRWLAETNGLDGPIFFFSFEHYHPLERVLAEVGRVFTPVIREQLHTDWSLLDSDQQRQVALGLLQQIPCLMIWDNFEPVNGFPEGTESAWSKDEQDNLRKFLVALQGGRTKVLITSRREEKWLGKIYRPLEISGLRPRDAYELAARVLRREGLDVNEKTSQPGYEELIRYLRGNPLAIRAILPELSRATPEELLSGLRSGATKFSHDDPKEGRNKSLTASLNYRLDALDPTLKSRLGILALFQGFVNTDVLGWMCTDVENPPELLKGLGSDNWKQILDFAAQVGLLRRVVGGCYTVHPALPWFFNDLLRESFPGQEQWFEEAFCKVYADYGSYLSDLFQSNAQVAMFLMAAEEENLLKGLRLAVASGRWQEAEQSLYGLDYLHDIQGRMVEWEKIVSDLEQRVTGKTEEPLPGCEGLFAYLLGVRAEILLKRLDLDGAHEAYVRQKEVFESAGEDRRVGITLHQLGVVAQERRQLDEAENWYKKSLEIEERIGDEHGQAQTLHQLGMVAQKRRQFDEAETWYRKSLEIKERIGNEHGQATTLHQLGVVAQERRQLDEAENWHKKSLEIEERIGDEHGQAQTLHQLGMVAQKRRQFDEAETWYRKSLEIKERIGNEHGQATTLHQLGVVAQERRQLDEAENWHKKSLEIEERIGDEHGQAQTLHQLGMVAQKRRQFDEAETWYRKSLEIKERIGNEHGQAQTLHQLGMVAQKRRQFDEAENWYRKSLEIEERIGNEHGQATTMDQMGILSEELGRLDEAEQWYNRELEIAGKRNYQDRQYMSVKGLYRVARKRGDEKTAAELRQRILKINPNEMFEDE